MTDPDACPVPPPDAPRTEDEMTEDLQARHRRLTTLVLRMGDYLTGPAGLALPAADWQWQFSRYQDHLADLRRLGDQLRPVSLRERPLTTDTLAEEVRALFAEEPPPDDAPPYGECEGCGTLGPVDGYLGMCPPCEEAHDRAADIQEGILWAEEERRKRG
jgi:hypothetical protein